MRLFRRPSQPAAAGEAEAERAATAQALARTRRSWFGRLAASLAGAGVTEELWESLEEVLIGADTGVATTLAVLERVRAARPRDAEEVRHAPGPAPPASSPRRCRRRSAPLPATPTAPP